MISEEQFEFIKAALDKSSISVQGVKDDLIDHFCCSIESLMEEGLCFEDAYHKTYLQVCPGGLNQIGEELFLLVHFNRIINMQKLKYSLGLLLSVCVCVGSLFKLMHWPGATLLLLIGLSGLVMLFLPMLAYNSFKEKQSTKAEKITDAFGFASIAIVGAGSILKVGQLMGGAFLLVGGGLLFSFGFLPLLFLSMYKKSLQQKFTQEPIDR